MELYRAKNVATIIAFPLVDADGDFVAGATGLDSEIDQWADGAAPGGFADCTNEATEIGSTGVYSLSLTQAEMNEDYIVVQVKSSAKTQCILINTKPITANTTQIAGAAVSTSTAQIGVNLVNIAGAAVSTTTAQLGVNSVQISASATAADNVETAYASTIAELTAPPAANAPIWMAIKWLFLKSRNKITQTATTQLVLADDGTTTVGTSTVSDDGTTATRGEYS